MDQASFISHNLEFLEKMRTPVFQAVDKFIKQVTATGRAWIENPESHSMNEREVSDYIQDSVMKLKQISTDISASSGEAVSAKSSKGQKASKVDKKVLDIQSQLNCLAERFEQLEAKVDANDGANVHQYENSLRMCSEKAAQAYINGQLLLEEVKKLQVASQQLKKESETLGSKIKDNFAEHKSDTKKRSEETEKTNQKVNGLQELLKAETEQRKVSDKTLQDHFESEMKKIKNNASALRELLDFEVEQVKENQTTLRKEINDLSENMEEEMAEIKEENGKMKTDVITHTDQIYELEQDSKDLEEKTKALATKISNSATNSPSQGAGFTAQLHSIASQPVSQGLLKFADVKSSSAVAHYSPTKGEFTAPHNGLYAAIVHIRQVHEGQIGVCVFHHVTGTGAGPVKKNEVCKAATSVDRTGGSCTGFVVMKRGEKLSVEVNYLEGTPKLSWISHFSCASLS